VGVAGRLTAVGAVEGVPARPRVDLDVILPVCPAQLAERITPRRQARLEW
jgi:hypothetical protein